MAKHWTIILVFLTFQISFSFAQSQTVLDSLKQVIDQSQDDTIIAKTYYEWGDLFWRSEPDTALKYYEISKLKAIEFLKHEPESKTKARLKEILGATLNDLGFIYSRKGNISDALDHYHQSLKVLEGSGRNAVIAQTMNNLGFVYSEQKNYEKALSYYQNSLNLKLKIGDSLSIATSYNNLGGIYEKQGQGELAIDHYRKAYQIRLEQNDSIGMSISLNNIGSTYSKRELYNEAYQYFSKSLNIQEAIDDKRGICISLINLCNIHQHKKNFIALERDAKRAYLLAQQLDYPNIQQRAAEVMKKSSVFQMDYQKAYRYYMEEMALKDSISKTLNQKAVYRQQAQFEYQKKAAIDSIAHAKEIRIKESEQKRQVMQRNMSFIGLGLSLLIVILIFRSNRQRKKANLILAEKNEEITLQHKAIEDKNEELKQLVEEVTSQRDKIESQKNLVEQQKNEIEGIHQEISESINYATRLQQSILPEDALLKQYLSDHFVFFRPKDKVSGDFYWWTVVEKHLVIAAADCTGHGVPGAFMSMLGHSLLREIVQKEYITHTGVILRKLRKEIIKALKQKGTAGEQKDGMDMAIISIALDTHMLQFSGANNGLYMIRKKPDSNLKAVDGLEHFYELKPDKMPIAIYEKMDSFYTHEIQLEQGDQLYLFSDGYADQFGGPKGKKFKYKAFKHLLSEHRDLSMSEQNKQLHQTFDTWKGQLEQIDDVLVLGLKI